MDLGNVSDLESPCERAVKVMESQKMCEYMTETGILPNFALEQRSSYKTNVLVS